MASKGVQFSVFTKPWKTISVAELGKMVSGWGFDGVEFPLRDGYQVEPKDAEKRLPQLVKQLAEHNLKVFSVASTTDENIFAACAEAGVPIIRIMTRIEKDGYRASVERMQRQLEQVVPLCEKYGVKVGIQQHYGNCVIDSSGLMQLVGKFDPRHIGGIWDAAHDALAGQQPEYGLDILTSHLCMANLKNAYYYRSNGPEAQVAEWKRYFTSGRNGLANWGRAAKFLQQQNYNGVVCLTAEYTAEHEVERLIAEDIVYAKSLFA
jgi:sugar phosphate isomerase/epimerase